MARTSSEETLKKAASGMKRKAHGAQRPRHNNELGEGASTAQRSDSPAQQFIQRFLKSARQRTPMVYAFLELVRRED